MTRGRPKIEGIVREKNGRASRAKKWWEHEEEIVPLAEQTENISVAVAYRIRVFGLSERDARDQRAATYIGRLNLAYQNGDKAGGISDSQYFAALDYLREYRNWQRAKCSKPDYQEKGLGSGEPDPIKREELYQKFCREASERWDERCKQVAQHGVESRSPAAAEFLRLCVIEDRIVPELVASGREILNKFIKRSEAAKRAA